MKISGWTILLLTLALMLSACKAHDTPSMRLGSLPYPGPFTLFAQADPDDLGTHHYAPFSEFLVNENSRGILYSCQAGFLDLSHVRDTIDLSWHYYVNFSEALLAGEHEVAVYAFSPCRYHVTFHLPEEWGLPENVESLPPDLNEAVIELSLQLAWTATAWYEFLQFFGYKSAGLIPEERSAFTYDDMMAHAVGVDVARKAIRVANTKHEFNKAATVELDRMFDHIKIVPPEEMKRAVQLVHGEWWTGWSGAIKRHLDVGHETGTLTPWLVRDLEYCGDIEPEPFDVPPLIDSLRPDGAPLATIEIDMRMFEAGAIRSAIPGQPERIIPHLHFPYLIEHAREVFTDQFGPDFDQPYPDDA